MFRLNGAPHSKYDCSLGVGGHAVLIEKRRMEYVWGCVRVGTSDRGKHFCVSIHKVLLSDVPLSFEVPIGAV